MARLKRWKVLKVATRTRNVSLALRAVGLRKLPTTIRKLYTPGVTAARKHGFW